MTKSYYEEKDAHTKLKQAEQHKSDQLAKARAELKSMKEKAEAARKTRPMLKCSVCPMHHLAPAMCPKCVDLFNECERSLPMRRA